MPSNTPNLGISHIATNQTQKEVTANTAFDEFDGAITALLLKAFPSDADYTLTTTEGGEAYGFLAYKFTGTISALRNIIVPAKTKLYLVNNSTTGGFSITVKTPSGAGFTIANSGSYTLLYCNGVDVVAAAVPPGVELQANKDAANGYAGLDASAFLKDVEKNLTRDARTTVTETISSAARAKLVTFNNGSAVAASIAQAGTAGLTDGYYVFLFNLGVGVVTLTPATSTVNGGSTITLARYAGALLYSDGTNYGALRLGTPLLAFTGLSDAPTSYSGANNETVEVNTGGTGLVFVPRRYKVGGYVDGTFLASQVLNPVPVDEAVTFAAAFAGSQATLVVAATASTVFNIQKNGTVIGTITFAAAASVGTFASTGGTAQTLAIGDILKVVAPASPDTTAAGLGYILKGTF